MVDLSNDLQIITVPPGSVLESILLCPEDRI